MKYNVKDYNVWVCHTPFKDTIFDMVDFEVGDEVKLNMLGVEFVHGDKKYQFLEEFEKHFTPKKVIRRLKLQKLYKQKSNRGE